MKLNLGCGFNKLAGFVNVDLFDECHPDVKMDLEVIPWAFGTNEVDEIVLHHALEHLGRDTQVFFGIIKELYRVCKPGAKIQIHVPHPRHDHFIGDPTHVRVITPSLLAMFSKKENERWKQMGAANSPLAVYLNVDFEIRAASQTVEEKYLKMLAAKQITEDELQAMITERNNIVSEYQITLEVIK